MFVYRFDFAVDEFLLLSRINCEEITSQPAADKLKGGPLGRVGVEEVLGILIEEPRRICKGNQVIMRLLSGLARAIRWS